MNCHCKHQVMLLYTVFTRELLNYWYLVSHIFSIIPVLLNPSALQPSPFPESLQLSWGNNSVQAESWKLQSSCEMHPLSWDTLTGHVRQPALSQRKGNHFCLHHLQLFRATLLWSALEERGHAYDFLYEHSSNSQLRLLSALIHVFTYFMFWEKDNSTSSAIMQKDSDNWLVFRQAHRQFLSWSYSTWTLSWYCLWHIKISVANNVGQGSSSVIKCAKISQFLFLVCNFNNISWSTVENECVFLEN